MTASSANPRVFISYAHEGDLKDKVKELADWLLAQGVEVITDHPYANCAPDKGWRAWMQHNVEDADIVLIVCSERYKNIFEKRKIPTGGGGRGVAWESAIITDEIYQAYMRNTKFYPLLISGDGHSHIPVVLRDWSTGLLLTDKDRIRSLIRDEVNIPKPSKPFDRFRPGELHGPEDNRLKPREGFLLGRESATEALLQHLSSDCHILVTGAAGIGKTEVCKAALKAYLKKQQGTKVFYVQIPDQSDALGLLQRMGEILNLSPEACERITKVSDLRPHMPKGLYYLDNLESVIESEKGKSALDQLAQIPGVLLLGSSRVDTGYHFSHGVHVEIPKLNTENAEDLFVRIWKIATKKSLPEKDILCEFVDKKLGGHPLSISLLARLGRVYSWEKLNTEWEAEGTRLAKTRDPDSRLESLSISLAITRDFLAKAPANLDLWQFTALFPEGLDEESLNLWEEISGDKDARGVLVDHHILQEDGEKFAMLPPLARYALEAPHLDIPATTPFSWERARGLAYQYFLALSRSASEVVSSEKNILARSRSAGQLPAIESLLAADARTQKMDLVPVRKLNHCLRNCYLFNVFSGRKVLFLMRELLKDGLSSLRLGDLETGFGNLSDARLLYEEAINLFEKEKYGLGRADALRSLGVLESRLNNIAESRTLYEEAIGLYKKEKDDLGSANALKALGDLESQLDNLSGARCLYKEAIALFIKKGSNLDRADALRSLGDLERRLGNVSKARRLYEKAIVIFKNEGHDLGSANILQALGNLLLEEIDFKNALVFYEEVLPLYRSEQEPMGWAYTLAEIIRCHHKLKTLESLEDLAREALVQAQASGVESVTGYVLEALLEACDGDEEKREALLKRL
ncbi:tetratricopeptide repeat protein [Desulfosarcina sp. OttesenSCG-928-A07]|nr:tetratricopeptide repeat protein [Desulfosarcina sp. OttesenSCG-928-A07]